MTNLIIIDRNIDLYLYLIVPLLYFIAGVAGAVRSLASISGLSDLLVSCTAFLLAAIVSEAFKVRSMSVIGMRTRVANGPTMYDLMRFKGKQVK